MILKAARVLSLGFFRQTILFWPAGTLFNSHFSECRGYLDVWRQHEVDALKELSAGAIVLAIIVGILASLLWAAATSHNSEAPNPDRTWIVH